MITRSYFLFLAAAIAGGLMVPGRSVQAANIVYSGSVQGQQVPDWRTSSTAKTKDIDGNNIYGSSMGAIDWNSATGAQSSGSTIFGWAYINFGSSPVDSTNRQIDSLDNAPADVAARIAQDYLTFEFTGVTNNYTGKTIRIGVMSDLLPSSSWGGDNYKGYQLRQTIGGSGDSGQISIRSGQGGDTFAEMYFFDVTNAKPGDQFQLLALSNIGGISFSQAYLGPVSFDIATVPEPGSAVLMAGGFLVYFALKFRRRNVGTSRS